MLILPILVSIVAPDDTESQWTVVFYILAVVIFITMMFFNFVCEVEPRSWTRLESEPSAETKNKNLSQIVIVKRESSKSVCKVTSGDFHNLEIKPIEEYNEAKKKKEADVNVIV